MSLLSNPGLLLETVNVELVGELEHGTVTLPDGRQFPSTTQRERHTVRPLHLRLPAKLVPMPGQPLDMLELEDWIVGAFCVGYQRIHQGSPPPLSHAAAFSGRSEKRVKASWRRLERKGWLGMAKVPHKYGDGRFGYRWRIWFPKGSPLLTLLEQRKGSGGERWIAVPQEVARNRSVLPTAMYMLAHEQRMVDGAVSLTPGEAAAILNCDRNTARRLLRDTLQATAVEVSPGRTIYDLPVVFEGKGEQTIEFAGREVRIYGERGKRLVERAHAFIGTVQIHGLDGWMLVGGAIDEVEHATGATARLDLVVKLLEERHRAVLTRNPWYRHQLTLRLSSRLRNLLVRPARARVARVARVKPEPSAMDGMQLRRAISTALTAVCGTCEDMRIVLGDDGLGRSCPDCSSG